MIRILSCDAGKTFGWHPRALTRHGSVHTTSHLEPSGPSIKFVATWYACDCRGSVYWVFILLRGHLLQTVLPMQNARISCLMNTVWQCSTRWGDSAMCRHQKSSGQLGSSWSFCAGTFWDGNPGTESWLPLAVAVGSFDISPIPRIHGIHGIHGRKGRHPTGTLSGRQGRQGTSWESVGNQLGDSSNFSNLPFGPAIDSLHEVNGKDGTTGQGLRSLRTLN